MQFWDEVCSDVKGIAQEEQIRPQEAAKSIRKEAGKSPRRSKMSTRKQQNRPGGAKSLTRSSKIAQKSTRNTRKQQNHPREGSKIAHREAANSPKRSKIAHKEVAKLPTNRLLEKWGCSNVKKTRGEDIVEDSRPGREDFCHSVITRIAEVGYVRKRRGRATTAGKGKLGFSELTVTCKKAPLVKIMSGTQFALRVFPANPCRIFSLPLYLPYLCAPPLQNP